MASDRNILPDRNMTDHGPSDQVFSASELATLCKHLEDIASQQHVLQIGSRVPLIVMKRNSNKNISDSKKIRYNPVSRPTAVTITQESNTLFGTSNAKLVSQSPCNGSAAYHNSQSDGDGNIYYCNVKHDSRMLKESEECEEISSNDFDKMLQQHININWLIPCDGGSILPLNCRPFDQMDLENTGNEPCIAVENSIGHSHSQEIPNRIDVIDGISHNIEDEVIYINSKPACNGGMLHTSLFGNESDIMHVDTYELGKPKPKSDNLNNETSKTSESIWSELMVIEDLSAAESDDECEHFEAKIETQHVMDEELQGIRESCGVFLCPCCFRRFATKWRLAKHLLKHDNAQTCASCPKTYCTEESLRAHTCLQEIAVSEHMATLQHALGQLVYVIEERKLYRCLACRQEFPSLPALLCHALGHGNNVYVCGECSDCFHSFDTYRAHVLQCDSKGGEGEAVEDNRSVALERCEARRTEPAFQSYSNSKSSHILVGGNRNAVHKTEYRLATDAPTVGNQNVVDKTEDNQKPEVLINRNQQWGKKRYNINSDIRACGDQNTTFANPNAAHNKYFSLSTHELASGDQNTAFPNQIAALNEYSLSTDERASGDQNTAFPNQIASLNEYSLSTDERASGDRNALRETQNTLLTDVLACGNRTIQSSSNRVSADVSADGNQSLVAFSLSGDELASGNRKLVRKPDSYLNTDVRASGDQNIHETVCNLNTDVLTNDSGNEKHKTDYTHDVQITTAHASRKEDDMYKTELYENDNNTEDDPHTMDTELELYCHKCDLQYAYKDTWLRHMVRCDPAYLWSRGLRFFICSACGQVFTSTSELELHEKKHEGPFRCSKCTLGFATKVAMLNHACSAVPSTVRYNCPHCTRSFKRKVFLERHLSAHRGDFRCELCGKLFERKDLLLLHTHRCTATAQIASNGYISCKECGVQFSDSTKYQQHTKVHSHPFECNKCGQRFMGSIKRDKHTCKKTTCTCSTCGKDFKTLAALQRHEFVHTENMWPCERCGHEFHRPDHYRIHMCRDKETGLIAKIHHTKRGTKLEQISTVCSICGNAFHNPSNLKKHMARHYDKKLVCERCGKKFHEAADLKAHISNMHGPDEKRFMCKLCGKQMKCRNSLYAHTRHLHSDTQTMYQCKECGKYLVSRSQLLQHIEAKHTADLGCSMCSRKFATISELERHLAWHDAGKAFPCDFCQRTFSSQIAVVRHKQNQHPGAILVCEVCNQHFRERSTLRAHFIKAHFDECQRRQAHQEPQVVVVPEYAARLQDYRPSDPFDVHGTAVVSTTADDATTSCTNPPVMCEMECTPGGLVIQANLDCLADDLSQQVLEAFKNCPAVSRINMETPISSLVSTADINSVSIGNLPNQTGSDVKNEETVDFDAIDDITYVNSLTAGVNCVRDGSGVGWNNANFAEMGDDGLAATVFTLEGAGGQQVPLALPGGLEDGHGYIIVSTEDKISAL